MNSLLSLGFLLISAAASSGSIKIIENTPSRLVFDWQMDKYSISTVNTAKGQFTLLSFEQSNCDLGESNEPRIPGYSLYVGVPATGKIQMTFIPQETRSLMFDKPVVTIFPQKLPRYPGMTFSQKWISDPSYVNLRSMRAVNMMIRPFDCSAGSNKGTVLLSARCTINFPSASSGMLVSDFNNSYGRIVRKLVLNYDIARNWAAVSGLRKTRAETYPVAAGQKVFPFKVGDGHAQFAEATTNENGLMKITGTRIIEQFGTGVKINAVALFASYKGELPIVVPAPDNIPTGLAETPLLRIDRNNNGIVDSSDFFIAYVSGSSDWQYDTSSRTLQFSLDRLDDYRHYWLTVKSSGTGADMTRYAAPSDSGLSTYSTALARNVRFKQSKELPKRGEEGGLNFIWKKLVNLNREISFNADLPYLDRSSPGTIQVEGQAIISGSGFTIYFGMEQLCSDCNNYTQYTVNDWSNTQVKTEMGTGQEQDTLEIVHVDITYKAKLDLSVTGKIDGYSIDSGLTRYLLSGLNTTTTYIVRVSRDETKVELVDTARASGSKTTCTWSDSEPGSHYYIYSESALLELPATPAELPARNANEFFVNDIRDTRNQADMLIVTHQDFLSEALRLAEHKKNMGFKAVRVVDIDNVFRYFAGGNTDFVALRNFIVYVRNYWTNGANLDYLILFGNGNYDMKRLTTSEKTFIPTAQIAEKCVDDFYTHFTKTDLSSEPVPEVSIGRLPAMNAAEAAAIVEKIIQMEDQKEADFGAWRNRMLLVADDDMQGASDDPIISATQSHQMSSDSVGVIIQDRWPSIDMRKVYLYEFPWTANYEKPEASQALINEINNGVAFVNYFGHGADDIWADEHIFTKANEDINRLTNERQYPIVGSFSCSVGRFDKPDQDCLSDYLVRADRKGGIAAVASTRLAFANANEALARNFYNSLFDTSLSPSLGAAYVQAKVLTRDSNQRGYVFLGDPSITMTKLQRRISVSVTGEDGTPHDTLQALQRIKIIGTVNDNGGLIDKSFGSIRPAYINLALFNPADTAQRKDGGAREVSYVLPGSPVFSGIAGVHNGVFEQEVLIPRNIAFDRDGVSLTAYAWQDNIQAVGFKKGLRFHGSVPLTGINDTTGPRITIRPAFDDTRMTSSASFNERVISTLPVTIRIDLYDESGVDVVGIGPDEGLRLEIPGVLSKRNINSKFQFGEGDFRKGNAAYVFNEGEMKPGSYQLMISAQDLLGNVSRQTFTLEILDDGELKLYRVFNYPNPMRMGQGTKFYFFHSNTYQYSGLDVATTVKIYTMSGKLLRVIRDARNGELWDGRDQAGNPLTPNIYLYQVTSEAVNLQKVSKSPIKKLVVYPPR